MFKIFVYKHRPFDFFTSPARMIRYRQLSPDSEAYRCVPSGPYRFHYLLTFGALCLLAHLVVTTGMFVGSDFRFISDGLMNHVWYAGTATVLFLLEHAVWVCLLWVVCAWVGASLYGLFAAYLGVLTVTVGWVMCVVVPTEPDPDGLHQAFAMVGAFGCVINVAASLYVLPFGAGCRYATWGLWIIGVIAAAAWFIVRQADANARIQPALQFIGFASYLCALLVGVVWAWEDKDEAVALRLMV